MSVEFDIKSIDRVVGKHNKALSQTIKHQGLLRMRIFIIAFAVIAAASAASISRDNLPPVVDNSLAPSQEYLAPAGSESETSVSLDGYRYKTVRKLKLRHRRDVSELVSQQYLPPSEGSPAASEEVSEAVEAPKEESPAASEEAPATVAVEAPEEKTVLADDGYRYKVVRRIRYRHRRDVNELPANEYLPPTQESSEESSEESASSEESSEAVAAEVPEEKTVLADDGYRYKVVRRIRYRHRRDVNELPANEYLPPNQESSAASEEVVVVEAPKEESSEAVVVEAPKEEASEAVVVEAPEEKTVLADDGYRYKVVRRIRYRHRRDVNELPANEYLPPNPESTAASEEVVAVEAPKEEASEAVAVEAPKEEASEAVVVEAPEEKTVLADDGYRYKVVRRIRYRHRRDVNELPANEYLPPNPESTAASEEVVAVEAPKEEASEAVAVEAPKEEASEAVVVEAPEEKTVLADDGYRYKVVRRIKYRHRRDVNELPASEYLPPNQESPATSEEVVVLDAPEEATEEEASATVAVETPEEKTVLADDGYRYKVVRRIRYRHRRDVNELPANEYLPPNQESSAVSEEVVVVEAPKEEESESVAVEAPEEKTVLADDGYRYKVVRRIRYRHRRDVNELPANEYLPPNQETSAASEEVVVLDAPVETAKEEASETVAVEVPEEKIAIEAPEEKTVLADDGYRYKVVRRIRYRHRRDVNELPANEYLPPSQESSAASEEVVVLDAPEEANEEEASATVAVEAPEEKIAIEAPEEKTVLADDGYRYKVVRRIRYRHRRDVSELPANEYLPPSQESSAASEEVVVLDAPEEATEVEASATVAVEAPEEKTVLADDGYRYKVVRRIRYRHRRDVNELPTNEYLPPNQESSAATEEVVAVEVPKEEASETVAVEAPEEKTVLAEDGYRYKVVRRIKYRRH